MPKPKGPHPRTRKLIAFVRANPHVTTAEMVDLFGVCSGAVSRIRKAAGVTSPQKNCGRPRPKSEKRLALEAAIRERSVSQAELARQHGVSPQWVCWVAKRMEG